MKKLFKYILVMILILPFSVSATNDFINAEEDITIDYDYDRSAFFSGNTVTTTADVDGLAFIVGNLVKVQGSSDYSFIAGANVSFKGTAERDIFIGGNIVNVGKDANINRDLYIAGNNVSIVSDIGRNLYVAGKTIDIANVKIMGNANIVADNIIFGENVTIIGTLEYNEDAKVSGLDKVAVVDKVKTESKESNYMSKSYIINNLISKISSMLGLLVVGFLLIVIFPKIFKKLDEILDTYKVDNYLSAAGFGFLVLMLIPLLMIILICTVIGIPLAVIMLLIYGLSIYTSTIMVAYLIGKLIFKLSKKDDSVYLNLMIGILIIYAIKLIPIISAIIGFVILILGLGIIYKLLKAKLFKNA